MRDQETTKHDYGHPLLIAGAFGRMGCAILAARAALRSGCGLVTVHLPMRCVDAMQAAFPEAMVDIDASDRLFTSVPAHLDRYSCIAVGPGIGCDEEVAAALHELLTMWPKGTPIVLDADALNILARHRDWLPLAEGAIITPHKGEYERLFGDADPAAMAEMYGITIVKKSHRTRVCSPSGRTYTNQTGNAGMATAGSGDVLTGIMAGLAAQPLLWRGRVDPFEVACRAVRIHGEIGDAVAIKCSESGLIASDMVEELRNVSVG